MYNNYIKVKELGDIMAVKFTVSLDKIINELSMKPIHMPYDPTEVLISSKDVNRPGLELTGFLDYFDNTRILVFGNAEMSFLSKFTSQKRLETIRSIFAGRPPAVIFARNLEPFEEFMIAAKEFSVPMLSASESTSTLIAALISYMNVELAPRITRHGVLVEVYGEGIFLTGDSAVGKSEAAIELIKRGHRLIADDAVEIRKIAKDSLVGSAPKNIRHFIELRGIGIINARRIFGMGAVKLTEKIDIVINLEFWDNSKVYDRMGMDNIFTNILGVDVPILTIPVTPGRNLAVIIEVAAMNNRQKKLGYNAAEELLETLGMDYDEVPKK